MVFRKFRGFFRVPEIPVVRLRVPVIIGAYIKGCVGARLTCGERCAARRGPVCEGVGEEAGGGLSLLVLGGVRVGVLSARTIDAFQ